MAIVVIIVDEDGVVLKKMGLIEGGDLIKFLDQIKDLDFKVLPFIDLAGDTIFNEKQMVQVKKELGLLEQKKHIDKHIIQLLHAGVNEALSDVHQYLKFVGE
jgi:hypothetical protein